MWLWRRGECDPRTCVCVYVYVYMYVYISMYMCKMYMYMYLYMYLYMCTCVHVYMRICVYVSMCMYLYMYVYIYMYLVPHKAVAEVSKIGNYSRRGELWWCMDGRASCWTERWLELCFLEWLQWSLHTAGFSVVYCSVAVVVVTVVVYW